MSQIDFNRHLLDFLQAATTPFHAVQTLQETLLEQGFKRLPRDSSWDLERGGKYYLTRNDSALVAFRVGTSGAPNGGMRLVGAHTDSPCLMVKPNPEKVRHGYFQLAVEVYGGVLLNPWYDRDLSLAGRVSFATAANELGSALIDYREPIATIPSLAIHLDREVNQNRSINPQTDILPVLSQLEEGASADFRDMLRARLAQEHPDCDVQRVLDYELAFYDSQPPAMIGLQQEFIASARLDNLLSCYTGMQALLRADGDQSCLLICNDHEEVGSVSTAGASGPLLSSTLRHIAGGEEAYRQLTERSMMISTDNAHAIHPNYADRHDDNHGPRINAGPVIKINANQRYASNSQTAGLYRILAAAEEVPVQSFVVRTDMGCGSTIGPITAGGTGIATLDIGVPTFGMHSIRELAGSRDAWDLSRVLTRFYNHSGGLITP